MAEMPNTRLSVPTTARRNEIIEIKTLIMHPMETGFRVELDGKTLSEVDHPYVHLHL